MSMEIIQSAATELLVNVALAVLALAGAYAVYYIRLGTSKLKAQTAQIEDASTRKVLDDALRTLRTSPRCRWAQWSRPRQRRCARRSRAARQAARSWSRWANRSLTRSRRRSRRRRSGSSRRTSAASTSI